MDWTIRRLDSPRVIVATVSGQWDAAPFEELVEKLSVEKLNDPTCSILIDNRALKFGAADLGDMDAVRRMFTSKNHVFANTRIAMLMYSIDHFFAAFQFQTETQSESAAEMKAFYDEDAALEWLGGGQSLDPRPPQRASTQ